MADDKNKRASEIDQAVLASDRAKQDAATSQSLDTLANGLTKICDAIGTLTERMDEFDKRLGGSDKSKDAADDDKNTSTSDDPTKEGLRSAELEKPGRRSDSDKDRAARADAQARCDSVAFAWGQQAPPPMAGEEVLDYRRRLLSPFQRHSEEFKDVDLNKIAGPAFNGIEARIYADARVAANKKIEVSGNQLFMRTIRTDAGHTINEFHGSPSAWMGDFAGNRQRASGAWKIER
jgi:hypothetical protein